METSAAFLDIPLEKIHCLFRLASASELCATIRMMMIKLCSRISDNYLKYHSTSHCRDLLLIKEMDKPRELSQKWKWAFLLLIFVFTAGIVTIIAVALSSIKENLPSSVDIVMWDRNRGRSNYQIAAVRAYMKFYRHIYVLTSNNYTDEIDVTYVNYTGNTSDIVSAFEYMTNISGISTHAMFISDQVFPYRPIQKSDLFVDSYPRAFNIFEDSSVVDFFVNYRENTLATLVCELEQLSLLKSYNLFLLGEITDNRMSVRNDFSRQVYINSDINHLGNNASVDQQFAYIDEYKPLFATFHTSGTNIDSSEELLLAKLKDHF
jgi:hypothetical protein